MVEMCRDYQINKVKKSDNKLDERRNIKQNVIKFVLIVPTRS